MMVNQEKLIQNIAEKLEWDVEEVRNQMNRLIEKIHRETNEGESFHIEGFGTFHQQDEGLAFNPEEALETELNYKYAGMEPVELAESNKDISEEDATEEPDPTDRQQDAEEVETSPTEVEESTEVKESEEDIDDVFGVIDEEDTDEKMNALDQEDLQWGESETDHGETEEEKQGEQEVQKPEEEREKERVEEQDDFDPGEESEQELEESEEQEEKTGEPDESDETDLDEIIEETEEDDFDLWLETVDESDESDESEMEYREEDELEDPSRELAETESVEAQEEDDISEDKIESGTEEESQEDEESDDEEFEKESDKLEFETETEKDTDDSDVEEEIFDIEEAAEEDTPEEVAAMAGDQAKEEKSSEREEKSAEKSRKNKSAISLRRVGNRITSFFRNINRSFPVVPLLLLSVSIFVLGFGFWMIMSEDLREDVYEFTDSLIRSEQQVQKSQRSVGAGNAPGVSNIKKSSEGGETSAKQQQTKKASASDQSTEEQSNDANTDQLPNQGNKQGVQGTESGKKGAAVGNRYGLKGTWYAQNDGRSYTLIIYSFTDRSNASDMLQQVKEEGYRSRIQRIKVDGTVYYRVAIGQFQSQQEALNAADKLKQTYRNNFFVRRIPNS